MHTNLYDTIKVYKTIGRFSGFRFEDFLENRLYESKLYELKLYELALCTGSFYRNVFFEIEILAIKKKKYYFLYYFLCLYI